MIIRKKNKNLLLPVPTCFTFTFNKKSIFCCLILLWFNRQRSRTPPWAYQQIILTSGLLTCLLACLPAYFLSYICLPTYMRPNCPEITVNSNPKSSTSHPLNFHRLYLVNFMINWLGLELQATPCHQKSPSRISTCCLLIIHSQFQAASTFPEIDGGGGNMIKVLRLISVQLALD